MSVADGPVVRAPVVHDGIDIGKRPAACQFGYEPSGGPGAIGTLVEGVVHLFGQVDAVPLGDLEYGAEALDQVDAAHSYGHAPFGQVL